MSILVVGHLAPDTDSTCTPLVYAWFLNTVRKTPAEAVVTGEINKEASYVLKKFDIATPKLITNFEEGEEVVLIDTNNPEELLPSIKQANILEIIDHHKLVGGLSTSEPINMTIRKYGCVATLVWEMIKHEIPSDTPKWVYGFLMSAIISDTLKLASPTTTKNDTSALSELSEKIGINTDEYAEELFSAKSDLSGMSAEDILLSDSKVLSLGSKKVRVSVIETVKPQNALSRKPELLEAMTVLKQKESLDYLFFYIVNILTNSSDLLVVTDEEKQLAKQAHGVEFVGDVMSLPGVVSRKKQIIPNLESVIK